MIGAHLRVVILVDADNLEIEGRGRPRRRIDLARLLDEMNGRELVRAIYYRPNRGFPENYQKAVEQAGFDVKRTIKNSDPWFICDAISFAAKYDCVVFVGGDGDLEPALPMLKARGAKVEVWSWEAAMSERLRTLVDEFVPLDRLDIVLKQSVEPRRSVA